MTQNPDVLDIELTELGAHHQRIGGLVERVRTANEAAGETIQPMAFGVFGSGLAWQCLEAQVEGIAMLGAATEAVEEHHQNVGIWLTFLGDTDLDLSALFATEVITSG